MTKLKKITTLVAAAFIWISTPVNAASISFVMQYSSSIDYLADGADYAGVSISDGLNGDIDFSVDILQYTYDISVDQVPTITSFSFNFGSSGATIDDIVVPGWQVLDGSGIEAFGDFDATLLMTAKGSADPLEFSIAGVEGDTIHDYASSLSTGEAGRFNTLFAANIYQLKFCTFEASNASKTSGGLMPPCIDKTIFAGPTTVVPLPPAMAMMFSAIALLGGIGLRRSKRG